MSKKPLVINDQDWAEVMRVHAARRAEDPREHSYVLPEGAHPFTDCCARCGRQAKYHRGFLRRMWARLWRCR